MFTSASSSNDSCIRSRPFGEQEANSTGTFVAQQKLNCAVNSTGALEIARASASAVVGDNTNFRVVENLLSVANPEKVSSNDPKGLLEKSNFFAQLANGSKPFPSFNEPGKPTANEKPPSTVMSHCGVPIQSYFDENLQSKFNLENTSSFDFIDNEMVHELQGKYEIISFDAGDVNCYGNEFRKEFWRFKANYRKSADSNFFVNDIVKYQYTAISKKEGFFGHLPSLIKRESVINKITLEKTSTLESGSDELLKVFLNETPNGKSTQRILKDFGLSATRIEMKFDNENNDADYFIHVIPLAPGRTISAEDPV